MESDISLCNRRLVKAALNILISPLLATALLVQFVNRVEHAQDATDLGVDPRAMPKAAPLLKKMLRFDAGERPKCTELLLDPFLAKSPQSRAGPRGPAPCRCGATSV